MKRNDLLWKGILEDIFDDFLRFFYKNADEIFDMERGFEFLDKELEDLFPNIENVKLRYVDKLVKVWLKSGEEKWFLIHIEVQGQSDKTFEHRMFEYYYRIADKFRQEITAWAIFSDTGKKFRPNIYKNEFLGTKISYQFNTYKILDQNEEALKADQNPFAAVILTVLLAIKKGKISDKSLMQLKIELFRHLLKRNTSKKKIIDLTNFLGHYVRFNHKETTEQYDKEINKITGKTYPMGIAELLLDTAKKEGIEEGIEKGIEKKTIEFIRNSKLKGLEIEFIAEIVDLTPERVRQILIQIGMI